ncbi:MAG: hypothetical protein ACRDD8_05310 [Bacteroidales bacterium]
MINVITGSNSLGSFFDLGKAETSLIKVVGAIESLNEPALINRLAGMDFLSTFIRNVEGLQGHTEGFEEHKVYVTDDGSYQDALNYEPKYRTWTFYRKGYIVKDIDFSMGVINHAAETKQPLSAIVAKRMDAIGKLYTLQYLPKVAYETLFFEPRNKYGSYTDDFGFLDGTLVDAQMMKPYGQEASNLRRYHWRGQLEDLLTVHDFEKIVDYMSEYLDVSDSSIVALGTRATLSKLRSVINADVNLDIWDRTGQPAEEINGVRFVKNDFMPKNILFFVSGDAPELITKLISPNPDFRGVALTKVEAFTNFERLENLAGSFFKIMPEGYHLTGRHFGLFFHMAKGISVTDPEGNVHAGIMNEDGRRIMRDHRELLKGAWYRGLRS